MTWSRNSINSQTNSTIYSSLLWLKQTMWFPDNQIVSQLPVQMHEFHDSRDKFKCHQKDRHKSNAIEVEQPEIVFSHESKQLLQHLIWKHIPTRNHSIVRKLINQCNYGKHDIKIMESNSTSWQEIMDYSWKALENSFTSHQVNCSTMSLNWLKANRNNNLVRCSWMCLSHSSNKFQKKKIRTWDAFVLETQRKMSGTLRGQWIEWRENYCMFLGVNLRFKGSNSEKRVTRPRTSDSNHRKKESVPNNSRISQGTTKDTKISEKWRGFPTQRHRFEWEIQWHESGEKREK